MFVLAGATAFVPAPTFARQAPTPPTPPPAAALPAAPDLYPPVRHASVVHALSLAEGAKADVLTKALTALSTRDADCKIRYGPRSAKSRPGTAFVLIEAPAEVNAKDIVKAVSKGAREVEVLAWTCLRSNDTTLGRGLGAGMAGATPRDFVLGMSNDLRWFEARGGFLEFFLVPGKLDAATLADRLLKLAQPFGVKDVGTRATDTFRWSLAPLAKNGVTPAAIDAAAARRAEKAILKLRGVLTARVDPAARTLAVEVALEGLSRGLLPSVLPIGGVDPTGFVEAGGKTTSADGEGNDAEPPRMRFDTNPIFDALVAESITAVRDEAPAAPDAPVGK